MSQVNKNDITDLHSSQGLVPVRLTVQEELQQNPPLEASEFQKSLIIRISFCVPV